MLPSSKDTEWLHHAHKSMRIISVMQYCLHLDTYIRTCTEWHIWVNALLNYLLKQVWNLWRENFLINWCVSLIFKSIYPYGSHCRIAKYSKYMIVVLLHQQHHLSHTQVKCIVLTRGPIIYCFDSRSPSKHSIEWKICLKELLH